MQTVKCRNPLGKCRNLVKMQIPTEQSWVGHGSLYLYPGDSTAGLWAMFSLARHRTILPPLSKSDN